MSPRAVGSREPALYKVLQLAQNVSSAAVLWRPVPSSSRWLSLANDLTGGAAGLRPGQAAGRSPALGSCVGRCGFCRGLALHLLLTGLPH